MLRLRIITTIALSFSLANPAQAEEEKLLNIYNWSDYISQKVLDDFEAEFGITINYDTYDSSEIVDAKLLAGGSGYDVVMHDTQLVSRLLPIDIFLKLDKSKLTNWHHLDTQVLDQVTLHDPGNQYVVPYFWGSVGWAYNVDMVKARVPDAPLNSADFIYKPEIISKLADCGVSFLASPTDLIPMTLSYLGFDQNTNDEEALRQVEETMKAVRPYIKYFDSTRMIQDLPAKEVCVAMSWSGDYAQAWDRAKEAGIDIELAYAVPMEGAPQWIDSLVIPRDAPHPDNAHTFINYIMRPEVIADITNKVYYANANKSSEKFIKKEILDNPAVYPPQEIRDILIVKKALPPKEERTRTRLYARVKSGL